MDAAQLDSTIEERIDYFEAEQKKQTEVASEPKAEPIMAEEEDSEEQQSEPDEPIHPADESHVISIEVFAQLDIAQALFDEIDDRFSSREIIGEIKLS